LNFVQQLKIDDAGNEKMFGESLGFLLQKLLFVTLKAFAGNPCTFRHGAEFGPGYLRVTDPSQPAIGTCNHVLAANEPRKPHETLRDEFGMLDNVARVAHVSTNDAVAGLRHPRLDLCAGCILPLNGTPVAGLERPALRTQSA